MLLEESLLNGFSCSFSFFNVVNFTIESSSQYTLNIRDWYLSYMTESYTSTIVPGVSSSIVISSVCQLIF
jgi:hypothetical protein